MSSGDEETIRLSDQLEACSLHVGDIEQYHAAIAIRRLVSDREADRAAMDDALNALVAVRAAVPDLHEYGNLAGNTLGSRVDAAISSLKARTQ